MLLKEQSYLGPHAPKGAVLSGSTLFSTEDSDEKAYDFCCDGALRVKSAQKIFMFFIIGDQRRCRLD